MGAAADKIELRNVEFHEQIGEGGFGTVHRVTFKKPYKRYTEAAAKKMLVVNVKEVEIMSQLQHPNIVTRLGFCQTEHVNVIFLEYARRGSLHDYLVDKSKPVSDDLTYKWLKDAALAIHYLHSRNFLHRDIKPKNCLLFEDNVLKLCDFGLTREIDNDKSQTTSSQKGTFRYMAPEIHKGNERGRAIFSTIFFDIYAYGMLILEIRTRKPPFDGMEYGHVIYSVGNGTLQPAIPDDCPQDLADIMKQCWNVDPKQRPTIETILATKNISVLFDWQLVRFNPRHQGGSLKAIRVACSPNRDMVVWQYGKLYILGGDGEYKMTLTSHEADREKQMYVWDIAVSSQGHTLVVDYPRYVQVFDVNGKYLHCLTTLTPDEYRYTKVELRCIAIDRDGHILVGDRERKIITIHTYPEGTLVNKVECNIGFYMAVNSTKQILYHFLPPGSVYSKVVAINYSGNQVFTFTPRIDEDMTGKYVKVHGIVCDAYDNIYIAFIISDESGGIIPYTGHLHQYSPTGEFLRCIASGIRNPIDLAMSPDGSLVVANWDSILKYSLA